MGLKTWCEYKAVTKEIMKDCTTLTQWEKEVNCSYKKKQTRQDFKNKTYNKHTWQNDNELMKHIYILHWGI